MKNFIILLRYKVPIEVVESNTPDHRAYLKSQYDAGTLLISGPFVPRTGGVLFGQAEERASIDQMISQDPFFTRGVAEYEVIEFNPVMHAPLLEPLIRSQREPNPHATLSN